MSYNKFEKGKEVVIFEKTCCTQRVIKPCERKEEKKERPCCCKCFCCCPCCCHKEHGPAIKEDYREEDKEDC